MRFTWTGLAAVLAGGLIMLSGIKAPAEEKVAQDKRKSDLRPLAFQPLPLGSIKPAGWLKKQLRIQADGLSGHLDEFWPDLKDSAWIGGKREGWERGPYWLDGVVPLAYQLDDDKLKAKVKHWMAYILSHQQDDGWLGPLTNMGGPAQDPWPLFVLFKAMTQYQEATKDERVIPALQRCLVRIDKLLDKKPLDSWGQMRWADLVLTIHWLYDRTRDKSLLDLAAKVHQQGHDWRKQFAEFPYKDRVETRDLTTHGVNNGMAIKTPGVWFRQSGDDTDRKGVFQALGGLDKYHGQVNGSFTCDEHLAGRNPSQGTELCTVVEAMYSFEMLTSILGDAEFGDRLERLAFNALPATFKSDMCAHQYDQQANQVVCKVAKERIYTDNGEDANLFGLEPNFGCCTANMHQGWPKFTSHLWMKTPEGLAAVAYAPCTVETEVKGKPVRIDVKTDYPFDDEVAITVHAKEAVDFVLFLRMPGWAANPSVEMPDKSTFGADKGGHYKRILAPGGEWKGDTTLKLTLPMPAQVRRGYHDSVAIERGPLVYSLKMDAEWKLLKGKEPFADWEVYPKSPWNYGLQLDTEHPEKSVQFTKKTVGENPFSPEGAPMMAKVKGRRLPDWKIDKNAAGPLPASPVKSTESMEELTLIPYGCTKLRVTEFPLLDK
jgi:uncharacterized protein